MDCRSDFGLIPLSTHYPYQSTGTAVASAFFKKFRLGILLSSSKLFLGLIKIKLIAVLLGVQGVGLLSLGLQLQGAAITLMSLSLGVVVINLGRPFIAKNDLDQAAKLLGTGATIVAINSMLILALILGIMNTPWLEEYKIANMPMIAAIVVSAFFMASATVIWEALSFLVDRYDIYVRANIIASIFDTAILILAAWMYDTKGVLYALLLSSILQFIVYASLLYRLKEVRYILKRSRPQRALFRPVLWKGLGLQTTSVLVQVSPLIARAHIVFANGESVNGYLQVATALAAYLLPFITSGAWGHLHPFVTAHGDGPASRRELHQTLLSVTPFAASACIAIVIGAPALLPIIYTKDFLPAQGLLAPYFAAEILSLILSVLTIYLIAIQKIKLCLIGYGSYHAILLMCVFSLSHSFGAQAYVIGHVLGTLFAGTMAVIWVICTDRADLALLRKLFVSIAVTELCILLEAVQLCFAGTTIHVAWLAAAIAVIYFMHPLVKAKLGRREV